MQLQHILISIPVLDQHREILRAALPGAILRFAKISELENEELAGFDALVGNPDEAQLPLFKNLKLLQLGSSGVADHYRKADALPPGCILTSSSGAFGQAISEHMLAALLMLMKKLHRYRDDMGSAPWKSRGKVVSPRGARVLVVGAGSIGTDFAKLMQGLGSHTVALRRSQAAPGAGFDEAYTLSALDEQLPLADVVALSLPETPQTIQLFDERRFSLMKQGSYLINVGRGSVLSQDALVQALESGQLAGAHIDVTEPEPLPADHPLWKAENLLLTPHISGFYHLAATHDNIVDIARGNLLAYPQGPYTSLIDQELGYRKKQV